MTSMHYGESLIGDTNVNNSMDMLLTWNLLVMSTPNAESLLSQSFKLSNDTATNIWIGSPFLTNLNVEDRLAFGVSLRMFTRSIVIQRLDAYTTYSNPRGFIYQNKDKKNKLMRIDELHKFSDGTLDDVRTALNDRLKGIRMEYLPKTIWRQSDRERAKAMIQAIDKQLKSRRIIRSLEKFVGGRPYEVLPTIGAADSRRVKLQNANIARKLKEEFRKWHSRFKFGFTGTHIATWPTTWKMRVPTGIGNPMIVLCMVSVDVDVDLVATGRSYRCTDLGGMMFLHWYILCSL
ncbi:hypothetical protein Tco_1310204 [Tanacetum coccineum]